MKNIIFLLLCLIITGCHFSDDSKSRSGKSKNSNRLTEEQKAALELGYLYGSKINLIALPQPLRNKSFAGIEYSMDELNQIYEKLIIEKSISGIVNDLTNEAFAEENPIKGAEKLYDVINAQKKRLILTFPEGTSQSQIWRVYRVGYALGYVFELAAIISRNSPTEQSLTMFTGLSQKTRFALPKDLASSNLPDNIQSLVRATNIEVTKTEDLEKIVKISQELYDLIRTTQ